jgi:hypothetical protein
MSLLNMMKGREVKIQPLFFLMLVITILVASDSDFDADASIDQRQVSNNILYGKKPDLSDVVSPDGLPLIGKWMFRNDGNRANWLGVKWRGKNLIEPINVILIDKGAKSDNDALSRLYENLRTAGFTERNHHSSGYDGYICGKFYFQIPSKKFQAFADDAPDRPNNHGRIFGPCFYKGEYVFIGAFSRELIDPLGKIYHRFGSFVQARDEFSRKLTENGSCKDMGLVGLGNEIKDGLENTTGDHDGKAVVLSVCQ